jgi:hypothetical protein
MPFVQAQTTPAGTWQLVRLKIVRERENLFTDEENHVVGAGCSADCEGHRPVSAGR